MEDVAAVEPAKVLVENTYILGPEGYGEVRTLLASSKELSACDLMSDGMFPNCRRTSSSKTRFKKRSRTFWTSG